MKFYDYKLWKRKYVDLWTIPHFLIGVLFAFIVFFEKLPMFGSFYLLVAVAVLWEIYEIKVNLHEEITNRMTDVLSSITGFYITVETVNYFQVQGNALIYWFAILVAIYILSNAIGWFAHYKRKIDGAEGGATNIVNN